MTLATSLVVKRTPLCTESTLTRYSGQIHERFSDVELVDEMKTHSFCMKLAFKYHFFSQSKIHEGK